MPDFIDFLQNNWPELLALTREHIFIVFLSTGLAIVIGLPLGILLTRIKPLQTPILGFANIMQTVPSLALFGLLIPIPFIGGIGAKTAVIALALYALLPVIRNTVTGILGIDPKVREAATAMGMTNGQILRMVELPLAMPVILTSGPHWARQGGVMPTFCPISAGPNTTGRVPTPTAPKGASSM